MDNVRIVFNCKECYKELPRGKSMAQYSQQQTYLTIDGEIAVWCKRHDRLIGNVTTNGRVPDAILNSACACCEGGKHDRSKKNT